MGTYAPRMKESSTNHQPRRRSVYTRVSRLAIGSDIDAALDLAMRRPTKRKTAPIDERAVTAGARRARLALSRRPARDRVTWQMGRPLAQSRRDPPPVSRERASYMIGIAAARWRHHRWSEGGFAVIRASPLRVVLVLAAPHGTIPSRLCERRDSGAHGGNSGDPQGLAADAARRRALRRGIKEAGLPSSFSMCRPAMMSRDNDRRRTHQFVSFTDQSTEAAPVQRAAARQFIGTISSSAGRIRPTFERMPAGCDLANLVDARTSTPASPAARSAHLRAYGRVCSVRRTIRRADARVSIGQSVDP